MTFKVGDKVMKKDTKDVYTIYNVNAKVEEISLVGEDDSMFHDDSLVVSFETFISDFETFIDITNQVFIDTIDSSKLDGVSNGVLKVPPGSRVTMVGYGGGGGSGGSEGYNINTFPRGVTKSNEKPGCTHEPAVYNSGITSYKYCKKCDVKLGDI